MTAEHFVILMLLTCVPFVRFSFVLCTNDAADLLQLSCFLVPFDWRRLPDL